MTDIYYSRVLDVPAEAAWQVVGDFGALARWFPFITKSDIRDGAAPTQVGAVRENTTEEGNLISEELVAFSSQDRSLTYKVIAGDIPMKSFISTLSLYAVAEDDRTFAVWTARYEALGDARETADWLRNDVFRTCLANLERVLTSGSGTPAQGPHSGNPLSGAASLPSPSACASPL